MTILLIEAYTKNILRENLEEPLLLEYAASSISKTAVLKNCTVLAFDMRIEGDMEVCLRSIKCNGEIWVMCFAGKGRNTEAIHKVFCNVKAFFPQAITVAVEYSGLESPILESPVVDVNICGGEPGKILGELVEAKINNNDFSAVAGISFFAENSLKITGQRKLTKTENTPKRDITACYRQHYKHRGKVAAWIHDCHFGTSQKRKPEAVISEIQGIQEENVVFSNIKTVSDSKWLKDVAVALKNSGVQKKYHLTTAPELVIANPQLLSLWKSVGLKNVSLAGKNGTSSKNIKRAYSLLNGMSL